MNRPISTSRIPAIGPPLETTVERGRDTAFVTVEVDYEVTLTASRGTVQLGGTVQLLDPAEEGIKCRFISAGRWGS